MTLDDLTVSFAHIDRAALLADWQWLIGLQRYPILITAIGDAFVQDADDETVHFLDCGAGSIAPICSDINAFRDLLTQREFVIKNFAPQIIAQLRQNGLTLTPGQLYGYKIPPHLGGEYSAMNFEPTDMEVHFSLLGQMHQKTQHLTPGTRINRVTLK